MALYTAYLLNQFPDVEFAILIILTVYLRGKKSGPLNIDYLLLCVRYITFQKMRNLTGLAQGSL